MLYASPNLLSDLIAWQAGGGGSFSGGGSGGGSFMGGGGGSDDGFILLWLLRLAFEAPLIGVPLLLFALFVFFAGARTGRHRQQERTIRKARPRREAGRALEWVAGLQRSDPDFDLERFFARVRVAFSKAQSGWCAQDLTELQPFVSDGVLERFSLQLEEQRIDGVRQRMQKLELKKLELLHVEGSGPFESLTVSVPFDAEIDRVELDGGKAVPGSRLARTSFRECWSFVRRRGAVSVDGEGLIEGKCPECKAPLAMNQSAKCTYCEAFVRSGAFDWVLAEITQASEWTHPRAAVELPGVRALLQRDPGLSLQLLEDRASVAFWRRCAAERFGTAEPLFSVATPSFREGHSPEANHKPGEERIFIGNCAVGSVRTVGILGDEDRDLALIEIVWDGQRGRVDADDARAKPRYESGRRIRRSLFVFERGSGQQTPVETTFTTAHCPGCGAADEGGVRSTCSYCDRPRDGDKKRWLLDRVLPMGSAEAGQLQREAAQADRKATTGGSPRVSAAIAQPELSPSGLLAWAAAGVRSGGALVDSEERAFFALARHARVPEDRARELLAAETLSEAPSPADATEARGWLVALAKLVLADGHLAMGERKFLRRAGEHFGLTRKDLRQAIANARAELYIESKRSPSG